MGQKPGKAGNTNLDYEVFSESTPDEITSMAALIDSLSYAIPLNQTKYKLLLQNAEYKKKYGIKSQQFFKDLQNVNGFVQIYLYTKTEQDTQKLVFQGQLKKGKRQGFGIQYDLKGQQVYCGMFKNNKYAGWGTTKNYRGEWHDNMKCGYGIYQNKNQDAKRNFIYEGQWQKDRFHGMGIKNVPLKEVQDYLKRDYQPNKKNTIDQYVGQWIQGSKFGCGKAIISSRHDPTDKQTYQGEFVNNKYQGQGMLKKGSEKFKGKFEKGTLVKN